MPTFMVFTYQVLIYIMGIYAWSMVLIPKYEYSIIKHAKELVKNPVVEVTDPNAPVNIIPGQTVMYNGSVLFKTSDKNKIFKTINDWAFLVTAILSIFVTNDVVIMFMVLYMVSEITKSTAIHNGFGQWIVRISKIYIAIIAMISIWCL